MSLHVTDIMQVFEEWAPRWIAWEKDNVGLQVGDPLQTVTKILITLDVTKQTITEAIARKTDLIISHHPLLFRPQSSITRSDAVGELILQLAENKISLFSAHTNLDFTQDGVSFALAETLGLKNIRFLSPLKNSLSKIIVFIPETHVERVMHVMTQAGAGVIGKYSSCSFGTKGVGTYYGSPLSNPFRGKRQSLEFVEETRLELITPRARVTGVIAAMKSVHPYEEIACDIYNVENPNPNFGMGALGTLSKSQSLGTFLKIVKRTLGSGMLRYTGRTTDKVQNIAVCSGAGSELLSDAIAAKADVFITADVRYHAFHTAAGKIAIVDAGHWETEQIVLQPMATRIRSFAQKVNEPLTVLITKHITNPIQTM
jgi:dinuclear metal center YbgI/SA1388 family protein